MGEGFPLILTRRSVFGRAAIRALAAGVLLARTPWKAAQIVDSAARPLYIQTLTMPVSKIQIGQLWRKDGTRDIYLVTRMYAEALHTMVVMRKSGAEDQAFIRVKVERTASGQTIPGFTPAQDE